MRNIALAVGLFVCGLIMVSTASANALTPTELLASASVPSANTDESTDSQSDGAKDLESIVRQALADVASTKPTLRTTSSKSAPKTYVVSEGDTLSAIAKDHNTSWQRLYDKNTDIGSPDAIIVGQKIIIPTPTEKLSKRPVPVMTPVQAPAAGQAAVSVPVAQSSAQAPMARGSAAGNSYYAGYCTWYAKSRRPDMPNNLGNAATWVARAAAQGFATGSAPRAGAIGQQGNHVVYVERVNANGTVTVSEMNYQGYGVVSSRTVPIGTFIYIY